MAKKPTQEVSPEKAIIECALRLAVSEGWRHVSVQDIADETAMSMSELQLHLPTKGAIFDLLISFVDQRVAEEQSGVENDEPPRERLFDFFMTRFECLSPYRDGIAAILRDSLCDPLIIPRQLCALKTSMAGMLDAAQISSSGPFGLLRLKGAMMVYASVFRIWLRDDTKDLSKTMVALDKALSQADRLARFLPG